MDKLQEIKIDSDGRYLISISSEEPIHESDLDRMNAYINGWWESGRKFLIINIYEDIDVKVERVDGKAE